MKLTVEKENAYRIMSSFKDFEGSVDEWKAKFYELWRYQLTWGFAYRIDLETKSGVYVCLLVREAYRKNVLSLMDDLGYKNVREEVEKIGVVCGYGTELDFTEAIVEE